MKLVIGKRTTRMVPSLEEASRVYCKLRDESGEGSSTWPEGRVGKYRIGYNGRVWDGKWVSGAKPVYDPYKRRRKVTP